MKRGGYTYILTNLNNTVFYVGCTTSLRGRIYDHRTKAFSNSFTAKYNCDKIVYFEEFSTILDAIEREKQIKSGSRADKIKLIEKDNPFYLDLWEEIQDL